MRWATKANMIWSSLTSYPTHSSGLKMLLISVCSRWCHDSGMGLPSLGFRFGSNGSPNSTSENAKCTSRSSSSLETSPVVSAFRRCDIAKSGCFSDLTSIPPISATQETMKIDSNSKRFNRSAWASASM